MELCHKRRNITYVFCKMLINWRRWWKRVRCHKEYYIFLPSLSDSSAFRLCRDKTLAEATEINITIVNNRSLILPNFQDKLQECEKVIQNESQTPTEHNSDVYFRSGVGMRLPKMSLNKKWSKYTTTQSLLWLRGFLPILLPHTITVPTSADKKDSVK